jgi:N-acetylglutamate synthase-like GNAT family acetyltransferase
LKKKYSPWLDSIVVYPQYRGQVYGKTLVEIAKQKIKEFGFKKLYLFTDKEEFYIKLGFKIIQKTKINNNSCSIMRCFL